jgi:FAD:protein FMN transferase
MASPATATLLDRREADRRVRVESVMGTAVRIDVRGPFAEDPGAGHAIEAAFARVREIDAVFSPYREDSEISRIGAARLAVPDASADVRMILAWCDELARTSGGAFDAWAHRDDGRVDPSALVKGWAVDEAVAILDAAGATDFAVEAGGDLFARGFASAGTRWRVGLRHPTVPRRVSAVVEITDLGVATSGAYERGQHIRDPRTGRPAGGLTSVTVIGPSLAWADAYATAAFVKGRDGLAWVADHPGYDAYATTPDLAISTPGFGRFRALIG